MDDRIDEFHAAYARNLSRLVAGMTLDIGDDEQGIEEKTVTVDRIRNVVVGVDSAGLFAGVTVRDTEGGEWVLYTDGTLADENDRTVGRHALRWTPVAKAAV